MPNTMPREKLSPDERREIVLAALAEDANKKEIAKRYGISRRWLYDLLEEAADDPEGKLEEAEKETEFRRRVREIFWKKETS